jgi:antitoxin component HigA of HigAB toxin-antitoxin module
MKTNGKTKARSDERAVMAWTPSSHIINIPANEAEYNELVAVLDYLLDTSDPEEQSPASALVDMIGSLIESYENANVPELAAPRRRSRVHRRTITSRRLKPA